MQAEMSVARTPFSVMCVLLKAELICVDIVASSLDSKTCGHSNEADSG